MNNPLPWFWIRDLDFTISNKLRNRIYKICLISYLNRLDNHCLEYLSFSYWRTYINQLVDFTSRFQVIIYRFFPYVYLLVMNFGHELWVTRSEPQGIRNIFLFVQLKYLINFRFLRCFHKVVVFFIEKVSFASFGYFWALLLFVHFGDEP